MISTVAGAQIGVVGATTPSPTASSSDLGRPAGLLEPPPLDIANCLPDGTSKQYGVSFLKDQ